MVVVLYYLCYLCVLPLTHEITAALFTLHIIQVSSDMVVRRRDSGSNLVRASFTYI